MSRTTILAHAVLDGIGWQVEIAPVGIARGDVLLVRNVLVDMDDGLVVIAA